MGLDPQTGNHGFQLSRHSIGQTVMTTITMYQAGNGDAFLIEHGQDAILIDGGYASTFQQHLAPDLYARARAGNDLTPCRLDTRRC